MRAVLVFMLATGCGFRVGGTAQPDGDVGDDAPVDAPDLDAPADAPIDGAIDAPRSWWDTDWGHRRSITIDGTQLAADLVAFPILIKIPAADLAGIAKDNCDDLRFVETDDVTVATYQLDTCGVADSKDTLVWLKRSLVHTGTTTLWLYDGNSSATKGTNDKAVFGSDGAGYESVHHLGASLTDVAANGHNLTSSGSPGEITGQIGVASDLDGNGDYYTLGQGDNDFDFTTAMSASAWVKVDAFTDDWQAIIAKADTAWRLARAEGTNAVGFGSTSGGVQDNLNGTKNINDGAWHHVAIVLDNGTKYLYVDGVKDVEATYGGSLDPNSKNVRIGRNEDFTSRDWDGQIDEVRISGVARSAAWIAAEHLTATSTTFVQIGADEPY
jgi:biopolymer transport protein ExbB